jgi:2-amino-4-hydroxy-6-hydroxymethyldihydropteridine diphosphokinase
MDDRARERIFIAIGSNIAPEANIQRALRLLAGDARLLALSTFYRSDPQGNPGASPFLNGAVEITTHLEPEAVKWDILRPIEEALGRARTADKNAPRTIDLDLLLYGNRIIANPRLALPNPGITQYPFVAIPLLDLAPDLLLPNSPRPLKTIVEEMDASPLLPLHEFTFFLRKDVCL